MDVPQRLTVPPQRGEHWAAIAISENARLLDVLGHLYEMGLEPVFRYVTRMAKTVPCLVFFYEVFEGECTGNPQLDELIERIYDAEWRGDCEILHIIAGSEVKDRKHPYGRLTVPPRPREHWASVPWTQENSDVWLNKSKYGFDAHSVLINGTVHIVFFYELTDSASQDDPRIAQIAELPGVNAADICHVYGGWIKGFDDDLPSVKMPWAKNPAPSFDEIKATLDETKRIQEKMISDRHFFTTMQQRMDGIESWQQRITDEVERLKALVDGREVSTIDHDALLTKMDALIEKMDMLLNKWNG